MIIAFSGTDGSGKSTQINLLSNYLKLNQFKIKIVWARGGYTPLFSFIKKILRYVLVRRVPKPGQSVTRDALFKNIYIAKVWLTISLLDLFLFYGLYVRMLKFLGFVVICDRYIEDTKIDFWRNYSSVFDSKSVLWRLLIWSLPTPNQSFLLYVPVDVSLFRSKMKGEPFPDTPETLKYRLECYLNELKFPSSKYYKIDCQRPVKDIHDQIKLRFLSFR